MRNFHYETVLIFNPVLETEALTKHIDLFRNHILERDGDIIYEKDLGLKKLAYPIQKKSTGFYYILEFSSSQRSLVDSLEKELKRSNHVIRFMTVALDKHGILYNEKKRARPKAQEEEKEEAS